MLRSQLIQRLSERNPSLFIAEIERLVDIVLERIIEALENGQRVELRGFGSFGIKTREAGVARNPRTGTSVRVDSRYLPAFKMGKGLRATLNGGNADKKFSPTPSKPSKRASSAA
jgi:integration host factor subunit beta